MTYQQDRRDIMNNEDDFEIINEDNGYFEIIPDNIPLI